MDCITSVFQWATNKRALFDLSVTILVMYCMKQFITRRGGLKHQESCYYHLSSSVGLELWEGLD